MRAVTVPPGIVEETLVHLQDAGRKRQECVVLWLAEDTEVELTVTAAYRPDQLARADIFKIPPSSMRAMLSMLRQKKLMIAAQIHSHPREAFHSRADDEWAIVRHVGALSLVVPDFALKTAALAFPAHAKVFRLDIDNRWREVLPEASHQCLRYI